MGNRDRRAATKEKNKEKLLNARVSLEDYLLAANNAERAGFTLSAWIRKTATRTPSRRRKIVPEINKQAYLELSVSLLEFSDFVKLIKKDPALADLRNGAVEKTLVKIVSQIFEVKKKLI